MLSLEGKNKKEFSPSARFIHCMCVLLQSVFPERTLSSGTGRGSALFHMGFILAKRPPLPGRVSNVVSVNPADVDELYPIMTMKRNYWSDFKAPDLTLGRKPRFPPTLGADKGVTRSGGRSKESWLQMKTTITIIISWQNQRTLRLRLPLCLLLPGLNQLKCPKVAPGSCFSNEGKFP